MTESPIIAFGGNSSAARSARVRLQWRDRFGRWVEMGRGIKFKVRGANGDIFSALGDFIGPADREGFGVINVQKDPNGLKDGFYEVASPNAQEILLDLSPEYLAKQGISLGKNKDGSTAAERADKDIPNFADFQPLDAPPGWMKNSDGSYSTTDNGYKLERNADGTDNWTLTDSNGDKLTDLTLTESLNKVAEIDLANGLDAPQKKQLADLQQKQKELDIKIAELPEGVAARRGEADLAKLDDQIKQVLNPELYAEKNAQLPKSKVMEEPTRRTDPIMSEEDSKFVKAIGTTARPTPAVLPSFVEPKAPIDSKAPAKEKIKDIFTSASNAYIRRGKVGDRAFIVNGASKRPIEIVRDDNGDWLDAYNDQRGIGSSDDLIAAIDEGRTRIYKGEAPRGADGKVLESRGPEFIALARQQNIIDAQKREQAKADKEAKAAPVAELPTPVVQAPENIDSPAVTPTPVKPAGPSNAPVAPAAPQAPAAPSMTSPAGQADIVNLPEPPAPASPPTTPPGPLSFYDQGPKIVEIDVSGNIAEQITQAIADGNYVAFHYQGSGSKPTRRVLNPNRVWNNPNNGQDNVTGIVVDEGVEKTFALAKMKNFEPEIKVPTSKPRDTSKLTTAELKDIIRTDDKSVSDINNYRRTDGLFGTRIAMPSKAATDARTELSKRGETAPFTLNGLELTLGGEPSLAESVRKASKTPTKKPVRIDPNGDVRKQLQDAIDAGDSVEFMYNDKPRLLKPQSIWDNLKNGKVNLYAEDSDGVKKNYTLANIQALPEGTKVGNGTPLTKEESQQEDPISATPEEALATLPEGPKPVAEMSVEDLYNEMMGSQANNSSPAGVARANLVEQEFYRRGGFDLPQEQWNDVPAVIERPKGTLKSSAAAAFVSNVLGRIAKIRSDFIKNVDNKTLLGEQGYQGEAGYVEDADGNKTFYKQVHDYIQNGQRGDALANAVEKEYLGGLIAQATGMEGIADVALVNDVRDNTIASTFIQAEDAFDALPYSDAISPNKIFDFKNSQQIGLLDFLVGNTDRHAKNWKVKDGVAYPIDHGGVAFNLADPNRDWHHSPFYRSILADGATNNPNPIFTAGELQQVRDRLEGLKPEFEKLDKLDWYNNVMYNMDLAISYAGTSEDITLLEVQNLGPDDIIRVTDPDTGRISRLKFKSEQHNTYSFQDVDVRERQVSFHETTLNSLINSGNLSRFVPRQGANEIKFETVDNRNILTKEDLELVPADGVISVTTSLGLVYYYKRDKNSLIFHNVENYGTLLESIGSPIKDSTIMMALAFDGKIQNVLGQGEIASLNELNNLPVGARIISNMYAYIRQADGRFIEEGSDSLPLGALEVDSAIFLNSILEHGVIAPFPSIISLPDGENLNDAAGRLMYMRDGAIGAQVYATGADRNGNPILMEATKLRDGHWEIKNSNANGSAVVSMEYNNANDALKGMGGDIISGPAPADVNPNAQAAPTPEVQVTAVPDIAGAVVLTPSQNADGSSLRWKNDVAESRLPEAAIDLNPAGGYVAEVNAGTADHKVAKFSNVDDAKAWAGDVLAAENRQQTNPITGKPVGMAPDNTPVLEGPALGPVDENAVDLARTYMESKNVDAAQREQINRTLDNAQWAGEVAAVVQQLQATDNKPNTVTKPRAENTNPANATNANPALVDIASKPGEIIDPNLILQDVRFNHPDHVVLANGDIVLQSRIVGGKKYETIVRRTKAEQFFTYVRETDLATGQVRAVRTATDTHSYKALLKGINNSKALTGAADPERAFNRKKGIEVMPNDGQGAFNPLDNPVQEYIDGLHLPHGKEQQAQALVEAISAMGEQHGIDNKAMYDAVAAAQNLPADVVENILAAMRHKRLADNGLLSEVQLRDFNKFPSHVDFNGQQLKEGDWVDWTEWRKMLNGKPNPNYGRVFRGYVKNVKKAQEAGGGGKGYIYTDNLEVIFEGYNIELGVAKPKSRQRLRASAQLVKVDGPNAPESPAFDAKAKEFANQENIFTPEKFNVRANPPAGVAPKTERRPVKPKTPAKVEVQVDDNGNGYVDSKGEQFVVVNDAIELQKIVDDAEMAEMDIEDIQPGDILPGYDMEKRVPVYDQVISVERRSDGVYIRKYRANGSENGQIVEQKITGPQRVIVARPKKEDTFGGAVSEAPAGRQAAVGDVLDDETLANLPEGAVVSVEIFGRDFLYKKNNGGFENAGGFDFADLFNASIEETIANGYPVKVHELPDKPAVENAPAPVVDRLNNPDAAWRKDPASERQKGRIQLALINRQMDSKTRQELTDILNNPDLTKGEASDAIGRIQNFKTRVFTATNEPSVMPVIQLLRDLQNRINGNPNNGTASAAQEAGKVASQAEKIDSLPEPTVDIYQGDNVKAIAYEDVVYAGKDAPFVNMPNGQDRRNMKLGDLIPSGVGASRVYYQVVSVNADGRPDKFRIIAGEHNNGFWKAKNGAIRYGTPRAWDIHNVKRPTANVPADYFKPGVTVPTPAVPAAKAPAQRRPVANAANAAVPDAAIFGPAIAAEAQRIVDAHFGGKGGTLVNIQAGMQNKGAKIRQGVDGEKYFVKIVKNKHINRNEFLDVYNAELLNNRVALALGITDMVAVGAGDNKSVLMTAIEGKLAEADYQAYRNIEDNMADIKNAKEIGLLDFLNGNGDRHEQNWFIKPDGVPVPIDHGLAIFPGGNKGRGFFGRQLQNDLDGNRTWFTKSEIYAFRDKLEQLKSEFEATGHLDWYNNMMGQFDRLIRAYGA